MSQGLIGVVLGAGLWTLIFLCLWLRVPKTRLLWLHYFVGLMQAVRVFGLMFELPAWLAFGIELSVPAFFVTFFAVAYIYFRRIETETRALRAFWGVWWVTVVLTVVTVILEFRNYINVRVHNPWAFVSGEVLVLLVLGSLSYMMRRRVNRTDIEVQEA
jgi:hypothetical protein